MAKLSKGQVAPGIAMKMASARESVGARLRVLELAHEDGFREDDRKFFGSLEALANWHDEQRGVGPLSVKTLRKYVDQLYPGGHTQFLREVKRVLDKGTPETRPNPGVIRKQREETAAAILEMTSRYLDLLERLRRLGAEDEVALSQLKNHLRIFGDTPAGLRRVK